MKFFSCLLIGLALSACVERQGPSVGFQPFHFNDARDLQISDPREYGSAVERLKKARSYFQHYGYRDALTNINTSHQNDPVKSINSLNDFISNNQGERNFFCVTDKAVDLVSGSSDPKMLGVNFTQTPFYDDLVKNLRAKELEVGSSNPDMAVTEVKFSRTEMVEGRLATVYKVAVVAGNVFFGIKEPHFCVFITYDLPQK